jgi:hypothetical protein
MLRNLNLALACFNFAFGFYFDSPLQITIGSLCALAAIITQVSKA